jgi:proteasome lid subunit RPN8/RPN11
MAAIKLPLVLYQRLVNHARSALPMEAVGLLGGRQEGTATVAIPLPNLAGPRAFWADPLAQFKAERQLEQSGLQLVAIYHSHPGGGTQLSPLDLAFAQERPCIQIVIALERLHQSGEEIRAYQILGDSAIEIDIQIDGKY